MASISNFRLYSFVNNVYMSPIQWGIQTAHLVGDMSQMFFNHQDFIDWASQDKTIIVCQGGPVGSLIEWQTFLESYSLGNNGFNFVVDTFFEDEYSLGGVITATGIILPQIMWDVERKFIRAKLTGDSDRVEYIHTAESGTKFVYDEAHPLFPLIDRIKSACLA